MSTYDYPPQQRGWGCMQWLSFAALMLIGAMVGVVLIALLGIWRTGDAFYDQVDGLFNPPEPTPTIDIRSVVVERIEGASDLVTTRYTMETVVEASATSMIGNFELGTTRLLYIAAGTVEAGVNLGSIEAQDVVVTTDTITITLPPPTIINNTIDVGRSRVYDFDRGFLSLGPEGVQLQSVAEQNALVQILASACSYGILEEANREAEGVVGNLLGLTGYRVEVITSPPAEGECPATQ